LSWTDKFWNGRFTFAGDLRLVILVGYLLLTSSEVQRKPALSAGTFAGILFARCGYISKRQIRGPKALTGREIKKAKKSEKPYKLSDGEKLFFWITPSSGKIWCWPIGIREEKSS
jgi:hypothetical protein